MNISENASRYDKIMAICLRRGFFYPASEIHNPPAGFFDYGSVGSAVKRNWENFWRRYFLGLDDSFYEIETTQVMPEKVFRASKHLEHFNDPITECKKCGLVERADHILESHLKETFEGLSPKELDALIRKHNVRCHKCGGELKEVSVVNLMFGFDVGTGAGSRGYLRPETAQGVYVSFKREYAINREKLPLGLAIVGRAYRNEISPRQGLFRMREFSQAELQIFFDPAKAGEHPGFKAVENQKVRVVLAKERQKDIQEKACKELVKLGYPAFYVYHMAAITKFYGLLGIPIRFFEKNEEERAFYNKIHFDIEAEFPSLGGFREVAGLHYRTDYDLAGHQQESKQDLSVSKEGKRFLPHVLELSFGVDRNVFLLLDAGFREEEKRTYFALPLQVAPYAAGVYPLVSKDGIDEKARNVYESLRKKAGVFFDEGGSIGRRYARADEIGVPFGITVDYDTLKDDSVTVRNRDTTKQERVKIGKLADFIAV
jgi:glycyl-tRNA synthetase